MTTLRNTFQYLNRLPDSKKMPALFMGHGNPMNALADNSYTRDWQRIAAGLPIPSAILCISAHWQTPGTHVLTSESPKTIHDFYGFPRALFDVVYPSPGAMDYAKATRELITGTEVVEDDQWGLDHGTWSILVKMFPGANIPVYQLSLDQTRGPAYHYKLANELRKLRNKGVLIIGSGNIVHNLRMARFNAEKPYDWAIEFDEKVKDLIFSGDHKELITYDKLGEAARLSIPTNEHYLPLLYALGVSDSTDEIMFFSEGIDAGSASMRSVIFQ